MEAESKEQRVWDEHPLTNLLVLKEVLNYDMSPQTILRNRLVSPTWLDACAGHWLKLNKSPVLRYTAVVPVEQNGGGGQQLGNRRVIPMSLPEFYELYQADDPVVMRMVARMEHSRLELHAWQLLEEVTVRENDCIVNPQVDRWFWKWAATPWLSTLTLVDCEFQREVWVFKERLLKKLPGLMNLTVRDCVVHPEAIRDINEDHQSWMDWMTNTGSREIRRKYIQNLRELESLKKMTTITRREFNHYDQRQQRLHRLYYGNKFRHGSLHSLDVSLTVAVGGDENGTFAMKPTTPLRIWGPLLAMVPKLKRLRIGGYQEDVEEPPPTLRPPGWDDDINISWKSFERDQSSRLREGESSKFLENVRRSRKTWLGNGFCENYFDEEPGAPAPLHLGNFWELIWDEVLGQVELSLKSLDLLDFSGTAQHFGVVSTYVTAYEIKDWYGAAYVYYFAHLSDISLDLGLDPVFAERDLGVLRRWGGPVRRVTLYRAPFHSSSVRFDYDALSELQLWGNVSPNLNFLEANLKSLKKLCWVTSCFDKEFQGQRLYHFMREGRRAYPLFRQDLVEKSNWSHVNLDMFHLEMDWGPMSLCSWRKLGKVAPNLTKLKGLIHGDQQLAEIGKLWPGLEFLEMAHGSRLTAQGLEEHLPTLANLRKFTWAECACTIKLFQVKENAALLQEIGIRLKDSLLQQAVISLPWNLTNNTTSRQAEQVCIQAEFEHALLTGESTRFFQAIARKL